MSEVVSEEVSEVVLRPGNTTGHFHRTCTGQMPSVNVASFCHRVQCRSAMLGVVQSILKAFKNVQWTGLNFFCS